MTRRVAVLLTSFMLAMGLVGCSGAAAPIDPNAPSAEVQSIHERIAGVWRLTNYVPQRDLSPALLLSMQADKIVVRFDSGTVSTVSSALAFERRYRIADVKGDLFVLFIEDPDGVEYESRCQFDESGNLNFETVTEPWQGRGVLGREGPAITPDR